MIHVLENLKFVSFCTCVQQQMLFAYINAFIFWYYGFVLITYFVNRRCDKLLSTIFNIAYSINLFVIVSGCDCLTCDLFYWQFFSYQL